MTDIRLIRALIQDGMTVREAVKEKEKYICATFHFAINRNVLKKMMRKYNVGTKHRLFKAIIKGKIKINKNLSY